MAETPSVTNKLVVDKDTVVNLWWLPYDGNPEEGVEVVSDRITDTGRWSVHHELIVKIKDKYYRTTYSKGATECQEERPWEYDKNITFSEMKKTEKLITVWVPVTEADNA